MALQVGCTTGETEANAEENTKADSTQEMTKKESSGMENEHPIRDEKNTLVTLETNFGKMTVELFHDIAPAHADSFAARSVDGFYSDMIFHRVIDGFMIQGGDPSGDGTGGPGYSINAEFNELPHIDGTLSMARSRDVNSAGSQFFVCLGRVASLDNQYTNFGQLINGYEVLHKIGKVPVGPQPHGEKSKPLEPVKLIKAYISDAQGNPIE
jgi:cyclophilin family peptidyl-prolyl cis-trans isomerase